ncbi:MAG: hypothetical protein WC047_03990 [Kiritimatiellales bacterium]
MSDFHDSSNDPSVLNSRNEYIAGRWKQLYELTHKEADGVKKFLFLVNSGGAVAMLGFIGTNQQIAQNSYVRLSLILFCIGIVFVGALHARILHRLHGMHEAWMKNSGRYWKREISYTDLINDDEKKSSSDIPEFTIGYLAVAAFIAGLIAGGLALFTGTGI